MEELTQQQIAKQVAAAFDSVNLIAELQVKETKTEEEVNTISRNIEHLNIMMTKVWFTEALSAEQTAQINVIINN